MNWSWSRCIISHHAPHAQTSSGKGLPSHFWNRNIVRSILPGLRRKNGEAQNPCCLKSSVKLPQSGDDLGCHVICCCWSTVISEVHNQRSIYQEMLEHFILPSADKLYGDADFIFQQDLAPAHTAKGTKSWFNDHGVIVLDWPANSPDLNPIDNLWAIIKRKMRDTRPNNADDLKAAIKATWASITREQCHRLISSMPRRIDAVIHAKGGPKTKYWVHRN